jgi:hypothetical protein
MARPPGIVTQPLLVSGCLSIKYVRTDLSSYVLQVCLSALFVNFQISNYFIVYLRQFPMPPSAVLAHIFEVSDHVLVVRWRETADV